MRHSYNFSYNAILWANPSAHPKAALYVKPSPYASSVACPEHATAKTETSSHLLVSPSPLQFCPITRSSYASHLLKTKSGRSTAISMHFGTLEPFYSFGVRSDALCSRPRTESLRCTKTMLCYNTAFHPLYALTILRLTFFFFFSILLASLPEPPCSSNDTSVQTPTSNWRWFLSQYHPFAYLAFIAAYS